jgi:hypothetical protein
MLQFLARMMTELCISGWTMVQVLEHAVSDENYRDIGKVCIQYFTA